MAVSASVAQAAANRKSLMSAYNSGNTAQVNAISATNAAARPAPSTPLPSAPTNPMAGSMGQANSQATSLPALPTNSAGINVGSPKPTPVSSPAPTTSTPSQPAAFAPPVPNRTAFSSDTNGDQQYQHSVDRYNQANPNNQIQPPQTSVGAQPSSTNAETSVKPYDTGDKQINSQIEQSKTIAQNYSDQSKSLENAQSTAQGALQDEVAANAQAKYQAEQANLDDLAKKTAEALAAKNAAVSGESEADKANAALQFERDTQALEAQRARSNNAYNVQIAEQQTQNTQRVLEDESRIAALGGYGNLTMFREKQFLTLQNDRVMNNLVFLKDQADRETTDKIQVASSQYTANLNKIEADKAMGISKNYDDYLTYVKQIAADKNLTEVEKYNSITAAAQDYTKNVAEIHNNALKDRYDVAEKAAITARDIYQKHMDNLRANLQMTTYTDNKGNVTTVARDLRTGKIISQDTLDAISAAVPYVVNFDPITGIGTVIDPATGKVTVLGSSGNAQSMLSGGAIPSGYNKVGNSLMTTESTQKIFQVGSKGKWCGEYANDLTDGPKVGDSWDSKISLTTIKPGLDASQTANIRPGMQMVLPLWKKTDQNHYGHDTVVTSYDPATGVITTAESNANGEKQTTGDGLGTVTTGIYNIKDLIKNYGSNFGFIPTTFKAGIQQQIDKAAVPYPVGSSQNGPQNQPNAQDLPGTNPAVLQGLNPFVQQALRDISSGKWTVDTYPYPSSSPSMKTLVANKLSSYDPNYNETLRTANAGTLQQANSTLAAMKSYESGATFGLDKLIELHKNLPSNKFRLLNKAGNIIGQQTNDPDLANFLSVYTDAMKQANSSLNNGLAGTLQDIQALEHSLDPNMDQKSFEKAVEGLKYSMSGKIQAQSGIVNTLVHGGNLADNTGPTKSPLVNVKDKLQTAKDSGLSPDDIISFLKNDPNYQLKIQNAIDAGLSPDDIVNHLQS